MTKDDKKLTPKEKVEEWSKALWERGIIDNFKKLDKKTRFEVRYYLTFGLLEFTQRCLRCLELRDNSSLVNSFYENGTDIISEFQKADEIETEEK